MKTLLALFGVLLLGLGLLAFLVAAINTEEWEGERSARAQAGFSSSVSTLAQADHESNTAFLDLWSSSADKQYHRLHDQRMNVLAISTASGLASLLCGSVLLVAGIITNRKIKVTASAIAPKLKPVNG